MTGQHVCVLGGGNSFGHFVFPGEIPPAVLYAADIEIGVRTKCL